MEAIVKPLLNQQRNPQELTNYSTKFEPITNLSKEENEILTIKYESKPFSSMTEAELLKATSVIILKIYIITGWAIPNNELKNILVDQLSKKIKESYANVNEQEVEFAFRSNLTVKDWGKSMNLVLIDQVLSEYLERRSDVSRMEEHYRIQAKQLPPALVDDLTDEDFIEANRAVYKLTNSYGLLSTKVYDILVAQGKMNLTDEEKSIIKSTAVSIFFSASNKENVHPGLTHKEQERYIKQDCKKIAVADYFNKAI